VTTEISSRQCFKGELISDVPGYFDTQGRDQEQQASIVDYV
jgi:hypothetical protein